AARRGNRPRLRHRAGRARPVRRAARRSDECARTHRGLLWRRGPPWLLEVAVTRHVGEVIEDTVCKPGFFAGEESISYRGIFAERDPRRYITAMQEFISARAKDRTKNRIEPW